MKSNLPNPPNMSHTRCLTLTFGDGSVMLVFSSGFEYFVHLQYVRLSNLCSHFITTELLRIPIAFSIFVYFCGRTKPKKGIDFEFPTSITLQGFGIS